jgi:conjugative relaxase-like TrwC/TraI family protein
VVADIAKLSAGRGEYYTRELATDHEAYLSGHGESPGRWYGAGATGLGLQGEASVAGFQAMFEGQDPTTGELLGRPHGRNAVPAFDVVLRPTKSVSILYGLGDAATGQAVLAAHHAGVREAVAYLDGHLGARRGHSGVQHVSGQGVLAVGFDHRTSREGDPLVHTHLVIANRVQGPDGRWTALDGRDLYRHRLAADAIYRATYQRELSRSLGVEWTAADAHGNRELQGLPEDLVRAFSKRSGQIDLEVERLEASGRERTPRLVKWAVHATRKAKDYQAADTLYGRWRTEAAERGHDPDGLVRQVCGRTRDRDQVLSEPTVAKVFDRLASPDGLTATASSFARQDVIAALGGQLAGAGRVELEDLADRFCAERAMAVVADRALEERRWSTPDLLAVERRLVAGATARADEQTAVVSHDAVRATLAAHPTAGEDQQAMIRDVCRGGAGVALVVGRAGTGKTFALGMARHVWQLDGYRPLATAPTGIATVSLEGEGFEEVATCDRILADLDHGREQLSSRSVLVVDEAGMVGSRKLARLLGHAEQAQAKVVLVGDERQLAAIDAGGGFRALRLRLGASELTENRRQHQAWEREALDLVRSGLVEEAVAAYRAHDRVVCAESKPAATLALLQDWWQAYQEAERDPVQDVIVLAGRRAEVDRLNVACQELLAAQGRLGPDRLQVEDLQLAVGHRVVCSPDLRRQSTVELRAERDRLRQLLDQAPRDRAQELQRASARRAEADQALAQLTTSSDAQRQGPGMLRLPWRAGTAPANRAAALVARQQADRAHDAELNLRRHQQRRAGWLEANAHLGLAYRQVMRELAWQRRARGLAAEHEPPAYLRQELGLVPESTRGRRVWRQAAVAIEDYRRSHQVTDPDHALGPVPREPAQRAAWQHARQAVERVRGRQRHHGRDRQPQRGAPSRLSPVDHHQQDQPPTRSGRDAQPRRSGPERAAG